MKFFFLSLIFFLGNILFSNTSCKKNQPLKYEFPDPPISNAEKPRYIWVDAAANFNDFANSKDNIIRDLKRAKDAGFTDIVVDVRPTNGDILFRSTTPGSQQVEWLGAWINGVYTRVERTATWDYLQTFVEEGHKLNLRVHAAINTMVGGHKNSLGKQGILYRDETKKSWGTTLNLLNGLTNTLDTGDGTKFFNPINEEVQEYLLNLLKDLAKYNVEGIILDRGRYDGIQSDFSIISQQKFQSYIGSNVGNFPNDILPPGANMQDVISMTKYPEHFKQWIEFRAKVMYDFMNRARNTVKSINSDIKFGVYVGGWYSTYYEVGVNWASNKFNPDLNFNWATSKYQNFGYAELMDHMLIGAYASPLRVYGATEWTMQGFCKLAKEKIRNACPLVAGGPDVGNWDTKNEATQEQENQAIVNSVKACMDECDGYFLFDMIHLKMANQWEYVKEGIRIATE